MRGMLRSGRVSPRLDRQLFQDVDAEMFHEGNMYVEACFLLRHVVIHAVGTSRPYIDTKPPSTATVCPVM